MDLIDRDKIREVGMFNGHHDKENADPHFMNGVKTVMEYVGELPAIDPVHAAGSCRCRECQQWDTDKRSGDGAACVCGTWSFPGYITFFTKPDDFCSYAEPVTHLLPAGKNADAPVLQPAT